MSQSFESLDVRLKSLEEAFTKLNGEVQALRSKQTSGRSALTGNEFRPAAPVASSSVLPNPRLENPNPLNANVAKQDVSGREKLSSTPVSLLPFVSVICFVLAGVFIVRLAIESGWLNPERQWGLVILLGLTLGGLGRFMPKVDPKYRSYLSAASVIVLYVAAYSSSLYFQTLIPEVSFVFAMGVSLLSMSFFHHHRSEIFPVLTSVGTYISPLLLPFQKDLVFHAGFFVLWAMAFSSMAGYLRTRTLSLTAAYFGIGVFTLLHHRVSDPTDLFVVIFILALQFLLFCSGVYYYTVRHKESLSQEQALAYLPVLLFFYGTTYYFLNRWNADVAPWVSLGFAGFVYFLYHRAKEQMQSLRSQEVIHIFLAVILFHSGYLQILPDTSKPYLLPTLLLAGFIAEQKDTLPKLSQALRFLFLGIGVIEFVKICFALMTSSEKGSLFPALITVVVGGFYYLKGSRHIQNKALIFLGVLHLMTVLFLYRLAYSQGSLAVSLSWGLYSALILFFGYRQRDVALAKSSLLVLLVTSLKALIFDALQAPSTVRIFSLLLTGIVLYGAGFMLKKINQWQS